MRAFAVLLLIPALATAQDLSDSTVVRDRLRLYYVGHAIGWEQYELARTGTGDYQYRSDFDYTDRGRRTHLAASGTTAGDFSPRHLEIIRITDSSRTVETRIDVTGARACAVTGQGAGCRPPSRPRRDRGRYTRLAAPAAPAVLGPARSTAYDASRSWRPYQFNHGHLARPRHPRRRWSSRGA